MHDESFHGRDEGLDRRQPGPGSAEPLDLGPGQLHGEAGVAPRLPGQRLATLGREVAQRRHQLGYARAARIVDMMEREGVVSMGEGSKPREVLVDLEYLDGLEARP